MHKHRTARTKTKNIKIKNDIFYQIIKSCRCKLQLSVSVNELVR